MQIVPIKIKSLIIRNIKLLLSLLFFFIFLLIYIFCLPDKLFQDPLSTVIFSENNELLGAKIADDGQWRFEGEREVPDKIKTCLIQFEDRNFYSHPGFNPISLGRAFFKNMKNKKIVQGGSTLTMQMIRLSRKGKNRTIYEKVIEIILATRAEIKYTKPEIFTLFVNNAPFGSNVVGLDAATWRYFGRPSDKLSWAEAATLAVLPNSPSLIYPGKNHERLLIKRNKLLKRLYLAGKIDLSTYKLSILESLPERPLPLPQVAQHLLMRIANSENKEKQIKTTIDLDLQTRANSIIEKHVKKFTSNNINNAAMLVADIETGHVLAYIGNSPKINDQEYDNDVDIINSPRSTGSILKPMLYAAALDDGQLLPNTLLPDIPVMLAGYSPKNYNKTFDGSVPARMALSRSLNIPSVFLLKDYGVDRFYSILKQLGISTLKYPASHYGLSLILGGAEGKLWDIAGIYASFGRTINHFGQNSGLYNSEDFRSLSFLSNTDINHKISSYSKKGIINAASLWLTFKALLEVNRPEEETGWEWFLSSKKVAWKTGTSFGFRDAWAVGVTSRYVVAAWVGNADGEGRPGLTGVDCAAPILFDMFDQLSGSEWFTQPYDEMTKIPVCSRSGYRAGPECDKTDSLWVQNQGLKTEPCPFHQIIHLDKSAKYRVNSDCESTTNMLHVSWFILPPVQEWYYKTKNAFYKPLPPYKADCMNTADIKQMEFIYPKEDAQFLIPVDIDNKKSQVILEVAHRKPETSVFWHLDGEYIGTTQNLHQKAINPAKGYHCIQLVDENGFEIKRTFYIR